MKARYLLFAICLACSTQLFSQSVQRSFKGRVVDTASKPMADVSVCIYRAVDTALLNFSFTTPIGNFMITTKSTDSLLIIISHMGYEDYVLRDPPDDHGWSFRHIDDVKLKPSPLNLMRVNVRASAIRMKGDTIEINATKFKVMPGSDVAQLFKKIPGFEVSVKGEIKVNGAQVSKILVDGSDFFGNNPGLVSKNLSADMVETVQVYEDKNEDGTPKEDAPKVINLKLKKGKKNGTFGDVMGGYGTQKRYEAGLRLNNFKNDRKFSVILNGNNTNETGFNFGFDNWHSATQVTRNGGTPNSDFFSYYSGNSQTGGNINNKLDGGLTYFNEYSRKRKLSFNAFTSRNKHNSINSSKSITSLNDSTERSNADSSVTNGLDLSGSFSIDYTKVIDSTGNFELGVSTDLKQNRSTTDAVNVIRFNSQELNRGTSQTLNMNDSREVAINGYFNRRLRKNNIYMFSIASNYTRKDYSNQSFQFIRNSQDTFNNLNERLITGSEFLVKLQVRMPVYKKIVHFNISADRWQQNNHSQQLTNAAANPLSNEFEQTYNNKVDTLSSSFSNKMEQYTIKPYFTMWAKQVWGNAGVTFMQLNLQNIDENNHLEIPRSYTKALPYMYLSHYSRDKIYAYFSANKNTNFPNISELMPILNISNPYERQVGNRDLSPQDNYALTTRVHLYKIKSLRYLAFDYNGSMSDNAKIWASRQNSNGTIIKSPENASGQRQSNGSFSVSKRIAKILAFNTGVEMNYSKTPVIVNDNKGFSQNITWSINPSLSMVKSDSLDFSAGVAIRPVNYSNTLNSQLNYHQVTYGYEFNMRALFKQGLEVSSSLDINDQRNVPSIGKLIPIWNAYLQYPIDKKGKYNLKLTAYDILKKNTNISRYSSGNFIYISQNNRLQQYFMLTLVYKIKKVGGGEDEPNYTW